jgi:anti-sigma B factor antagonist
MPELHVETERPAEDTAVLRLGGYLDAHTFEELDQTINDLFEEGAYKIVADLSGLQYISSAGAGVFIGALAMAQENAGNIVISSPTEAVHEVFDLLGLTQIFTLTPTVDEALASL